MIRAESSDCFCAKLLHLFFFWPRLHVATMLTRSEPTGLFSFLLQLLHLSNMEMLMACWQYYHFVFVDISSNSSSSSLTVCPPPTFALSSWRSGLKSKFHFALSFDSLSAPWRWCLNNFFSFIMKHDKD